MENELKPCPFCGGKAVKIASGHQVVCCKCCTMGQLYPTENQAIETWNRRTNNEID